MEYYVIYWIVSFLVILSDLQRSRHSSTSNNSKVVKWWKTEHSYNGRRIENHMWSITWHHFQQPWMTTNQYCFKGTPLFDVERLQVVKTTPGKFRQQAQGQVLNWGHGIEDSVSANCVYFLVSYYCSKLKEDLVLKLDNIGYAVQKDLHVSYTASLALVTHLTWFSWTRPHCWFVQCVRAALMYSACGVILCKIRGAEDELNTLAAATVTGLAYKSTGLYGYVSYNAFNHSPRTYDKKCHHRNNPK